MPCLSPFYPDAVLCLSGRNMSAPSSCSLPLLSCPLCPVFVSYFLPFVPLGQIIFLWAENLAIIRKPTQTKIIIILQSKVVNQSVTVLTNGSINLGLVTGARSIQHEWWLLTTTTLESCTQHVRSWSLLQRQLGNPAAVPSTFIYVLSTPSL